MGIIQISRIQVRRGPVADLPTGTSTDPTALLEGEIGLATDNGSVFIGTPNLLQVQDRIPTSTSNGSFPYANTQILTEWSRNIEELTKYVYRYRNQMSNNEFPGPGSGLDWTYDQASPWSADNQEVTRYLQERLDEIVSVKAYGAIGDGVTDDTYAIWRAAMDVIQTNTIQQTSSNGTVNTYQTGCRRRLYFPAGTYIISRPLLLPPYSTWFGDGIEKTIIQLITTSNDFKSHSVVETIDDGLTLDQLNEYWNASTPSAQYIPRTENGIGTALDNSSNDANLPQFISVEGIHFIHAGYSVIYPNRDIIRLNRSSISRWINCRFEGQHCSPGKLSYSYNNPNVVTSVLVINQGTGYTSASVIITDTTGNGATATAVISNGSVISITVNNMGSGYTSPIVTITGNGSGATAGATIAQICNVITTGNSEGAAMYNSGSITSGSADSIGIFIDGLGSVSNPTNHLFSGCQFYNTTYAFSMTDQVSNVIISNCSFERHYRAFNIGEEMWFSDATSTVNIPLTLTALPIITDPTKGSIQLKLGMRVLLTNQSIAAQNGLYSINASGSNYVLVLVSQYGLHTNGDDSMATNGLPLPGKSNGPFSIKITNNHFKSISSEAIFVGKGRDIISSENSFDDTIGRGYGGDNWDISSAPIQVPVIYFSNDAECCGSINDWFGRLDTDISGLTTRRRVLYDPYWTHMYIGTQDMPNIPDFSSKYMTVSLSVTSSSQFLDSGILIPISKMVYNSTTATYVETVDAEFMNIPYSIGVASAVNQPRCVGEISIASCFNASNPTTSTIAGLDTKKATYLNIGVTFQFSIIKYANDRTYVRIQYSNTSGNIYQMCFGVKRWKAFI